MTPQEALKEALRRAVGIRVVGPVAWDDIDAEATAILAALPEGWYLADDTFDGWMQKGAQQERERLRAHPAVRELARRVHGPDGVAPWPTLEDIRAVLALLSPEAQP